jgi:hypothetical protein
MWLLAAAGDAQGVFFWAAFYVFAVCGWSVVHQIRVNRWPGTVGELTESSVAKLGATERVPGEQQYHAAAEYHYSVNGQSYTGRRVSPWVIIATYNLKSVLARQMKGIQQLPDGQVMVYYNLNKPQKSFLITPGIRSQLFTAVIGVAPFVFYWLKYQG